MSKPELKSLDDYQQFLTNMIKPWSREQRIALTAAMAERWLPVYESFSEEEDWGDQSLRQDFETPETQKAAEQTARNVWQLPQVQDELKKQLETIEVIGAMVQIDKKQIKALCRKLTS